MRHLLRVFYLSALQSRRPRKVITPNCQRNLMSSITPLPQPRCCKKQTNKQINVSNSVLFLLTPWLGLHRLLIVLFLGMMLFVSWAFVRCLWLLIICGFFTLFTVLISTKLKYLLSHPKNVDVSVEYKHDLQFPAVTICNYNMLRWRIFLILAGSHNKPVDRFDDKTPLYTTCCVRPVSHK